MSVSVNGFPGKYIQGPDASATIGKHVAGLNASQAFLIGGARGLASCAANVDASFSEHEISKFVSDFRGECSWNEVNRLVDIAAKFGADVIVAIGGGKALDTSKLVADKMNLPIVIVPTTAATDAPCSALSVVYTDNGEVEEYKFFKSNPNVVLVDTTIIAKAPKRYLASGMGDALSTFFEAEQCAISRSDNFFGALPSMTALALAKLCRDTLLEYGVDAMTQCEAKCTGAALNKVVEANTLLSGVGFESGGIAAAHAVHNGLCELEACHAYLHGEKVAFGVLTQLVLCDTAPAYIQEIMAFCHSVGLPVTLQQIGVDIAHPRWLEEDLMRVAEKTCIPGETIHNLPFKVNAKIVADAIVAADALGRAFLAAHK
jgi:glycerol dehydrogenase